MNRSNFLRLAIAALLLAVTTIVFIAFRRSAEPSYQGQPLSRWLEQVDSNRASATSSEQAKAAIRHIGTKALPTLIRMVQARDSALKQAVLKWSAKQTLIKFDFTPAGTRRNQAQRGYEILGPEARTQVPALGQILTNDGLAGVRQCAASALGWIGPEAKSAAAALLITAKDQDTFVRNNSLWALSRIQADPGLVLPGLIKGLDDSFKVARENAAIGLAQYGPLATSAVPALVRTMKSNTAAKYALRQIDPKAASRQKENDDQPTTH